MDNLSPHKSEPTVSLIARVAAEVLFLPASSPEFNPIEKCGAKSKPLCAAPKRTHSAHIEAIASALESITPQDARNWFAHIAATFLFKLL